MIGPHVSLPRWVWPDQLSPKAPQGGWGLFPSGPAQRRHWYEPAAPGGRALGLPSPLRARPHPALRPLISARVAGQGAAAFEGGFAVKALRKAVLPVAGLGTRFLPATKAMAKEMLPVVDKPLIQYAVEEARAAGIEQFCLITGRGKTALVEHFDVAYELEATLRQRNKLAEIEMLRQAQLPPGSIVTVRQQEPLGLGHAIWCARAFIGDDPFAILLPDDLILSDVPCTKQLADAYRETGGNVVAVVEVPWDQTNKYGILQTGADDGRLVDVLGLVEKPKPADAPSNLSIIGRYVLLPDVIQHLARMERGAGNEVQLTDGMAKMIGNTPFHGLRYEGRRFDCGDKIGFLEAQVAFALARPDMAPAVRAFLKNYQETV